MPKQQVRTLFQFSELSDDAQMGAIEREQERRCIYGIEQQTIFDEFYPTLEAFADSFGVDLEQVRRESFRFELFDDCNELKESAIAAFAECASPWDESQYSAHVDPDDFKGIRLWKWLQRQSIAEKAKDEEVKGCALTGTYPDLYILAPIIAFLKRPDTKTSLEDLIRKCLNSWQYRLNECIEDIYSEDVIREYLESGDEFLYLENGTEAY